MGSIDVRAVPLTVNSDRSGFGESLTVAGTCCSFVCRPAEPETERDSPIVPGLSIEGDGPSDFELLAEPPDFLFLGTSCSLNVSF